MTTTLALYPHWADAAACTDIDPDSLFVRGAAQRQARSICFRCSVRLHCLADSLDAEMMFGVWGGMTERERRALLRRHPEERNWKRRIFEGRDPLARFLREGEG
ncbi:WhiB family transcriptional regulator [Actinotignum schaalii]|uniref:Transcriptional regulator WhiB n=1 Tax=Actinotignum schaalii FB123-CNA-2 TaxID=883067 RepID=S2W0G1_9ACTO|nr:WhiB family transcriptional regulator [Actinotignum schaalii]EPD26052.1 hypothetical protein HMPREF9237_01714 [Actinotignum schaalii FB123-CNA-2]